MDIPEVPPLPTSTTSESVQEPIPTVKITKRQMMEEGKKRIDSSVFAAITADDQLQTLKRILKLQQAQIAKGEDRSSSLTLTGGGQIVQIDFEEGEDGSRNIPDNADLDIPYEHLFGLTITNDGPGHIFLSVNKQNPNTAKTKLLPGEQFDMRTSTAKIRYLNLVAPADAATIRITGII